jgi:hypothetical protein
MLLYMVSSGPLDAQLQQIAWSMASRMQLVHPAEPWDEYHDATVEERRAGCLGGCPEFRGTSVAAPGDLQATF